MGGGACCGLWIESKVEDRTDSMVRWCGRQYKNKVSTCKRQPSCQLNGI